MSKKLRIIIAIIVIIILGVAGFFIAKKIEQENRKYNIENISEYNYFVIKVYMPSYKTGLQNFT